MRQSLLHLDIPPLAAFLHDALEVLPRPRPQLRLHVPLDLVAPAVQPADVQVADVAHAVRLDGAGAGLLRVLGGAEADDAGLLERHDLPLEADVDAVQRGQEGVHGAFERLGLRVGRGGVAVGRGRAFLLAQALDRFAGQLEESGDVLRRGCQRDLAVGQCWREKWEEAALVADR